ncbi:MAG: glycosyltransferase [Nitrospirae bacterium]|nr:glycosyltransferase [Nitrospirota bacterium]
MNILFISTENPYPPVGGHHIRTYNILKILAEKNKIYFIGFAQHKKELNYSRNIKELCETVDSYLIPKTGYNFHFLLQVGKNLFSKHPLVSERYLVPEAKVKLKEILSKYNIELVHIDMLALASYVKEIINNIPTILTNHNVEYLRLYRWMKTEQNFLIKSFLYYQYLKLMNYERKTCPLFNRCIVVSEEDKMHLLKLCKVDNFTVIPNGVDIDYFKPLPGKIKKNHLVWVGGMAGHYNADAVDFFLRDIWPILKQEVPKVTIEFIGKSPTNLLQEKAMHDPNIKILGFVEDIRNIVQSASIFVAPIRSGSGTKIKVINAMAQAKAVVTTSIGAEGIIVENGKNILIADSPEEFAKRVVWLLRNEDCLIKLGQNARHLIEQKYSWKLIAQHVDDSYSCYDKKLQSKTNAKDF